MDLTTNQKSPPAKSLSWNENLQGINNLLLSAAEVLILLRPNPDFDLLAAGLSLLAALKKIGRITHVVCPTKIKPETLLISSRDKVIEETLVHFDQVIDFLPQNQLRLEIDYIDGSYSGGNIQKNPKGLTLTLLPEEGKSAIEPLKIDTRLYKSQPEVIFCLGIENLASLQQFYLQNQGLFQKLPIINIDCHDNNNNYGKVNIIDPQAKSFCEIVTLMLYDLRFNFDQEISTMLYAGMMEKTNNFAKEYYGVNMLEALSICYRYLAPATK